MIELCQVEKTYAGGREALQGVDLRIGAGEMVFVTGHSGAGKSTLLKLLVLIERATRGAVLVAGQDLARLDERSVARYRRGVGVVFQDHRLLMDRTVSANVALPLMIAGYAREEVRRRVRAALDRVGLREHADAYPIQLSTGEQQRVGIARAVVHKPALVLADEPTGNLDPELSAEIMRLFQRFNQVGVTVVVASHDLALINAFRCRRVTLEDGRLVADSGRRTADGSGAGGR